MSYKIGQSIQWHKATWDGTLNPIVLTAFRAFVLETKNFGMGRKIAVLLSKGTNFWAGFDLEDLKRVGGYLIKIWIKNPQLFNKHKQNYYSSLFSLRKYYKKIRKEKLSKLSNKELVDLYLELFKAYLRFGSWCFFCEPAIEALQPLINQILLNCSKKYPAKLCQSLVLPSWFSFLRRKELLELNIALKISQSNKLKRIFRRETRLIMNSLKLSKEKSTKSIRRSLNFLQKNYHWVYNNYVRGKYLTLNFFIKEVKKILKQYSFNPQKNQKSDK